MRRIANNDEVGHFSKISVSPLSWTHREFKSRRCRTAKRSPSHRLIVTGQPSTHTRLPPEIFSIEVSVCADAHRASLALSMQSELWNSHAFQAELKIIAGAVRQQRSYRDTTFNSEIHAIAGLPPISLDPDNRHRSLCRPDRSVVSSGFQPA